LLKTIEWVAETKSTKLDLSIKSIMRLPSEIGQLTNLNTLWLSDNYLVDIPSELGKLTNLKILLLHDNYIADIPSELGKLTNLTEFNLANNQLTILPSELGNLKNLATLYLHENQLITLPAELGKLTKLTEFYLHENQLKCIPAELGKLTKLTELYLFNNQLTSIPAELGNLTNLTVIYLSDNKLKTIPAELGKLTNLTKLYLHENQLKTIPAELGKLANLTELSLSYNQLKTIPAELGKLTNLTALLLYSNQLTSIPAELGKLTKLNTLDLDGNKALTSPPPEVVKQGTKAILAYLREQLKERERQWVSKLLVVGEGGVGKTSLLMSLREEEFVEGLETTHGIGVDKLELKHPSQTDVTMELNTWDFGGQQIYHATHQFFLTNRSLFVLVWDARHGWEAGKLYSWLDRIQAKAPDSPVMIVAAHIDERDADLPLDDLKRKYPQIKGHYKLSNKTCEGFEEFKERLVELAANLPLMGEEWPASWLDAANEIRSVEDSYISPQKLGKLMAKHKVNADSASVLAQWLHELGDILYFKEDDELNDLVILNPQWVTEAISDVLESEEVIEKDGILTRKHRDKLWGDVDENIREHFLRLMERFDLSYRTLDNREVSLVVERLPLDPPDYHKKWQAIQNTEGCKEISMKFELSSVPAGIPTWFIARSHRFSTHTHWRMGALFSDSEEQRHLGLIVAYPHERYLRLTVRGPVPNNFFVLLRDGLELTLARFPGLEIERKVPCPGHSGVVCRHEFDFADLQSAVAVEDPVLEFQCPKSRKFVSVTGLLYGLDILTQNEVIKRLDALHTAVVTGDERILMELGELKELTQRQFLRLFNAAQSLAESHCPNVFAILPKDDEDWQRIGLRWIKDLFSQKMVLQLYCQAPGEWHPAEDGVNKGRYEIKKPAEFLVSMGPYIVKLAKVIKYAAPVAGAAAGAYAGPIGAAMGAEYVKKLVAQIKLMEELSKKLTERDYVLAQMDSIFGERGEPKHIEGMELRALRALLDKEDPVHEWGGLKKVLTPEGHYLWLCEHHAAEYKK